MKRLLAAAAVALAFGGSSAYAACEYNGTYYAAGSQLCFDGWLQECTVADYWAAIGMCKAPDLLDQRVDARPLAETLIAKALGTDRDTETRLTPIVR